VSERLSAKSTKGQPEVEVSTWINVELMETQFKRSFDKKTPTISTFPDHQQT